MLNRFSESVSYHYISSHRRRSEAHSTTWGRLLSDELFPYVHNVFPDPNSNAGIVTSMFCAWRDGYLYGNAAVIVLLVVGIVGPSLVIDKLKQFQRMRSFLTVKAAVLVYNSMLLPILEYGDLLLSAASALNRKKLQSLQNKGLRCALNKGLDCGSAELHTEARLCKLHIEESSTC